MKSIVYLPPKKVSFHSQKIIIFKETLS
jgi:hypothetical protein